MVGNVDATHDPVGGGGLDSIANCDGRDDSKQRTYAKEVHAHAPGR